MATVSSTKAKRKVHKVIKEKKEGTLKSGSGKKVKSRKQAVAILQYCGHSNGENLQTMASARW